MRASGARRRKHNDGCVNHDLQALIFDFDGTIADTERDGHRVAYNAAFRELGLPWQWDVDTYGRLLAIAGGKERLTAYIEQMWPAYADGELPTLVRSVHATKARAFRTFAANLPLRPGIARVAGEARAQGVRLAIATTAMLDGVQAVVLAHGELTGVFQEIGAGDVVAHKKPAPDIYRYVLERLGIPAANAVAVEDSATGLRAALAAGLTTLVTPSDFTADEDFSGAVAVVSDLGEPGRPARTLAGSGPPTGVIDLTFIRSLLPSTS